jgi:hypothetical protein
MDPPDAAPNVYLVSDILHRTYHGVCPSYLSIVAHTAKVRRRRGDIHCITTCLTNIQLKSQTYRTPFSMLSPSTWGPRGRQHVPGIEIAQHSRMPETQPRQESLQRTPPVSPYGAPWNRGLGVSFRSLREIFPPVGPRCPVPCVTTCCWSYVQDTDS